MDNNSAKANKVNFHNMVFCSLSLGEPNMIAKVENLQNLINAQPCRKAENISKIIVSEVENYK